MFAQAQERAHVRIDRIEFTGVTLFEQSALESILEIGVGDFLERVKIRRTQENLQSLYQMRGYEEVQVRSDFIRSQGEADSLENVLKFSITEGRPSRISSVQLVPQNIKGEKFQKFWNKIEPALVNLTELGPGKIFDQEKIAASKRSIQDYLASAEFVGVKVNEVRLKTGEPPLQESSTLPTARWIDLEFLIELGDRVTFGFRGNTVLSRSMLDDLIEERRTLGFGQDYVGAIKNRIEEEYRNMAYAFVKVTPFTFEHFNQQERHVTYEIQEGPKTTMDALDFDGNVIFSNADLQKEFFDLAPPLLKRKYYAEKEFEKTVELLIEWLKSQGYLSAKLITVSRIAIPKKNAFRFVIYLYEGDQTTVEQINFKGVRAFSVEEVLSILGIQKKYPLNLFAFNEGIETFKSAYRAKGYLEMVILNEDQETVIQYSNENRSASVFIEVEEGFQYRVSRINIEGLTKTREEVVQRELTLLPDEIIEEHKLFESEARLRKLGIFSSVSIRIEEDSSRQGYKIIRIVLQEGTPGLIAGGIGFRNDLGFRVFGQTAYSNLWRRNHTLLFNANLNRRFDDRFCANEDKFGVRHGGACFLEYVAELGYVWPWFAFGDTTFGPKLTVENTQFLILDAFRISFLTSLERKLLKTTNLIGGLAYQLERTEQYNAQAKIDNQKHVIGALIPSLRLDLRDNSLAPTKGIFSSVSFEFASPVLLSQGGEFPISYTRFQWRTDGFVPLGKGITWFLSFRTGYERNLVTTPEPISEADEIARRFAIPLIKQFTLGGVGSVRGFGEQKINKEELAIRGTLSYVNYRTQVDFPFAGALKFGPFLDAANLLDNRFSFGNLRYGAGFGFHYASPIGPVNFDLGFNLFPQENESPSEFHFSIGVI